MEGHFRVLPESPDEHDQIELGLYLDQFRDHALRAVPFLVTQEPGGPVTRIAVSRDLAEYCHDRLQAWSLLNRWTSANPLRNHDRH